MADSIRFHIEAVQYTPGTTGVVIHYIGKDAKSGPFSRTSLCVTNQAELSKRSGTDAYWSDAEVIAALTEELASHGIVAEIALPEPEAPAATKDLKPTGEAGTPIPTGQI